MNEILVRPRYLHDCDTCVFLGHFEEYDLYFCPARLFSTVVARFSGEIADYTSGLGSSSPALVEAEVLTLAHMGCIA